MRNAGTIAWATYHDTVRRPLYYILIAVFALLIFCSNFLTLFTFNQEANMVREMGVASLSLWGFLIFVILSGVVVTQELEDRTAITLLAKPLTRSAFLIGKFLGLAFSCLMGMVVLAGVLFFTLWWMARQDLFGSEPALAYAMLGVGLVSLISAVVAHVRGAMREPESDASRRLRGAAFVLYAVGAVALMSAAVLASGDRDRADVAWQTKALRERSVFDVISAFMGENGVVVLQGAFLSFLEVALLGAICVSLAAFVPAVVSVAGTALAFILGNLSSYLLASVERSGTGLAGGIARFFYYLLPNLGYFNLQTHFSEGSIISSSYLGLALLHAVLYSSIVLLVSCTLFERRDIR